MADDIANSAVPETVDRLTAVRSLSHDSVPTETTVLRLIDKMCDEFETAWLTGDSPSIEKVLSQVAADYRPTAFRELLLLDLDYGRDRGLETSPDVYLRRFPDYRETIRETFAERDAEQVESHGNGTPLRPLFNVPSRLGDYELLQEIGRGGMGVVYKSRQISLDRIVALKLIRVEGWLAEETMRRFQIEARAAARMQHPGIVQIYEIGHEGPWHFFSMEYIEGRTLANVCSDGPLSSVEAAHSLISLATAVQHAHDNGILHRDLKPSNILIDKSGRLRIADFGIAKQTEGSGTMTTIGQILGTPGYMSPEQARGGHDRIDCRCDVYSLGAVLYALLTQRAPFQGRSPIDTLVHVLHDKPRPPHEWNSGVDPALERICLNCLNKDPAERFESATALREALEQYLAQTMMTASAEISKGPEPLSKSAAGDSFFRSRRAVLVVLLILVTCFVINAVSMRWRHNTRVTSTDNGTPSVVASVIPADTVPTAKPIDQRIKLVARPGALDPSFGEGGIARVEFGHGGVQHPFALAIQSDGKIVAAGQVTRKRDTFYMSVARFLPDGRLDTTFNTTGKMLLWIGVFDDGITGRSLLIQQDGKIVLGGRAEVSAIGYDFALVRLGPDGSMDTSFGNQGIVTTNVTGSRSSVLRGLVLQPDGKIVAAGTGMIESENTAFVVARYLSKGSLDDGFGRNGYVTVDLPGKLEDVTHTVLRQDGKIVVVGRAAGSGGSDLVVLRHDPDGTPDQTFGGDGRVVLDFGETNDMSGTVSVQESKLIVHANSDEHHYLLRLNDDGSIDSTFGENADGRVTSHYAITGFAVTPEGEIVVANANHHRLTVLSADGVQCATYEARDVGHETSKLRLSFRDMVRAPDGKLVFCGWLPGEVEGTSEWILVRLLGPPPCK